MCLAGEPNRADLGTDPGTLPTRVQRWREHRASYRPAGEPIDPRRYGVEVLLERDARRFVVEHHYSRSFPAARLSVGLYRSRGAVWAPELAGVAVFSVGVQRAALPRWTGVPSAEGVELGRFVLLDDVPANGETWFLRRAFAALVGELPEVRAVLAYSDPLRRTAADGSVVMPGHLGTIYQAFNGRHLGRSRAETLVLDREGRVLSRRGLSKIRLDESGAASAAAALLAAGAPRQRPGEGGAAWVTRALQEGPFRRVRHPGNLVYAWPVGALARATARGLPEAQAYPKRAA